MSGVKKVLDFCPKIEYIIRVRWGFARHTNLTFPKEKN